MSDILPDGATTAKEFRKVSELINWDKNPRSISESGFNRLKKQIAKLGQYKPLLITPDGTVIGGNMRLRAYKELGIDQVWVSVVEPKNEKEKLEYALSDNDRAGYYDDDLLASLTAEMPDFNWADYSVDLKEPTNLGDLIDQFTEVQEDEVPELSNESAVSQLGDVYQLGRHRLMCGDSTKIEDVEKLMDGKKADMVFTDPPYGINFQSSWRTEQFKKIENDNHAFIDFLPLVTTVCKSEVYICSDWKVFDKWYHALMENNLEIKNVIVWNKNRPALMGDTRGNYDNAWELIFYCKLDDKDIFLGSDRDINVWTIDKDHNYQHPTQKPVEISARAIKNSKPQTVVDLFGGSGSTLIACEQTNRTCYMMELDPRYCDVIRKRYAKFIGKEESWQTETPPIQ